MSSYDASSYNLPHDTSSQLKGANYMQLDMKNSMLQSRLTRNEKLLEEFEKKNAVHTRTLKIISKYVNALSNGAKRFMQKSFKLELANLMQACGKASDIADLVEVLTEFVSSIKVMRTCAEDAESKQQTGAKSVDHDRGTRNALRDLKEENHKLKAKLEKLSKGQLECYSCHASIDIKKVLQLSQPLMMNSHIISGIGKQMQYDSMAQSNTLDISKFSELRSLHSFLNEDKGERHSKLAARANPVQHQRDSICIDDSSVFLKKNNNARSQNTSAVPILSINDTIDDIKPRADKSHANWVIKEMEDSEKTETDYSIMSEAELSAAIENLGPKNLLDDFNKAAESYEQSFFGARNPKSEDKPQLREINSFSTDSLRGAKPQCNPDVQVRIKSINLSAEQREESNLIDKTLNSHDSSALLPSSNPLAKNMNSNHTFARSQETLKVEAVYAFRQQKAKASPNPTSVEEISFEEPRATKRVSLMRNLNDGMFKSVRGEGPLRQVQTTRALNVKGLYNSKSGNNISAKARTFINEDRDELPSGRNTATGFFKPQQATAEDRQRLSTRPSTKPGTTTTRTLCSTEKSLNSIFSNNASRQQKPRSKLAN